MWCNLRWRGELWLYRRNEWYRLSFLPLDEQYESTYEIECCCYRWHTCCLWCSSVSDSTDEDSSVLSERLFRRCFRSSVRSVWWCRCWALKSSASLLIVRDLDCKSFCDCLLVQTSPQNEQKTKANPTKCLINSIALFCQWAMLHFIGKWRIHTWIQAVAKTIFVASRQCSVV